MSRHPNCSAPENVCETFDECPYCCIAQLEQELDQYKNGCKGGCYACEPVGELNVRLEKENAALRSKVTWYDHHHAKLRACCEMLTGPLWPQNEATEKLAEVLADFPTPPEEPNNASESD